MDITQYQKSEFKGKIQELVKFGESLRLDPEKPTDITFAELVKLKHNVGVDALYESLGVDPNFDTISNLFTSPDQDVRWLLPEIFRDALRLGYRKAPIWPAITAVEEPTKGLSQIIPSVNMSNATPKKVGEGETIPLGDISYQSKQFRIYKYGRGIKLTDEVSQYVSLSLVAYYLQDFGVKMGMGIDTLAISTLINGEQADGSEAAPVVGIKTPGTLTFRDILKIWIRMSVIGRLPSTMVGSETMALDTMDLPEFKNRKAGANNPDGSKEYTLDINVNLPTGSKYFIHGGVSDAQTLILDPSAALLKLNAQPMRVESERIVSNQSSAFYASFATGFAKMFTDACLIMDTSLDFATHGFPEQMNPYASVIMD